MLTPILWVPLYFLNDVIIRLHRLLSIGLLLLLAQPDGQRCRRCFSPGCGVR
jgi:hypothetical protein